jgi:hypothetical protein
MFPMLQANGTFMLGDDGTSEDAVATHGGYKSVHISRSGLCFGALGTLIEQACGSMSFPLTDDMEGPAERDEACAARGPNEQTKVGTNVVELVMDREEEQDGMMLTSAG